MSRKELCLIICIVICVANVIPVCAQSVSINFQPPGEVPAGYLADFGDVYGDRGNGFSYGWDADQAGSFYNRHSSSRTDLRYDTLAYFPKEIGATWEIALENDMYDLFVVCGDPCSDADRGTFEVENNVVSRSFHPGSHDEFSLTVLVSDGRLTIAGSYYYPLPPFCFVDIRPSVGPRHVFPPDSAVDVSGSVLLQWSSDPFYETYNVYFGESLEDVNNATIPIASGLDVNSFDPGPLEWGHTYFWRVDGVYHAEHEGIVKGKVGSFQVEPYLSSDRARMPYPVSGSVDVSPDTVATWRGGRDADQHIIYMSADVNAMTNGTAAALTSDTDSIDLTAFDLLLGETYYWRVDEVNETNAAVKAGPVWCFSTAEFLVVDDFERYTNFSPNRVFMTWVDGYGYPTFDWPPTFNGNDTGGALGHDIWSQNSPHYDGSLMETSITHSGRQSVPFYHTLGMGDQATYSEADLLFDPSQDWHAHGIQTLILYFYGDPCNTGNPLYVKVNDEKIIYPHNEDLQRPAWHQWAIELALLNTDLQTVTSLHIGIEGPTTEEFIHPIYIDDIGLHRKAPESIVPTDPGNTGLVAMYSLENNTDDTSGNGRHAMAVGNLTYQVGVEGTGLEFDGTGDQYVDLGTFNPSADTGQLSVSMWAKRTGHTDAYQGLIGKRDSWAADSMMWQIELNQNTGAIGFAQPGSEFLESQSVLRLDEWTHVGVTYDSEEACLLVHGQKTKSGHFTLGSDTEAALVLGACGANGGHPFHGALDEVRLYNRALTEGEMLYQAGQR